MEGVAGDGTHAAARASGAAAPAPRPDLYTAVHKGLRTFMSETLAAVGRMDVADPAELAGALEQVRGLLSACRHHLELENRHIHSAMEARSPNAAGATAADHVDHERAFAALEANVQALERAGPAHRAAAALHLYRRLAVFVGENFLHMHVEETENTALLWQTHTDAELVAIHQAIVASIPSADMAVFLRWMVPALGAVERAAMLGNMRRGLPSEAFAAVLATVRPHLREHEWEKLARALAAA
ncbi:MAG: hypothetical protein KJ025_11860 [Burkholderiales bacterium]|nr:hypothetical protein [Burkholderiales bacterium]